MNNNNPTLLILAAGMASRYGSLKQVDSFGPSGETIIDYSIHDAIKAGFKKVKVQYFQMGLNLHAVAIK